ncbi:MAG: 2-amino-4-hydroxy-6-hydroxymethyldihydropteridine diphosphokinase [Alphaproteobacteria bacterium]|nr:2-amino-4-hydroxy-6-hydroxymethyldihydropteridine diphosphokinase [Alphaproteobacteria bacterium]
MKKHQILLSFGANLPSSVGQPEDTLRAALRSLDSHGMKIIKTSRLYRTKAVTLDGVESVPDFINAAALVEGCGTPEGVLAILHTIEASFGRERLARWSARTLDIDLIAFDDVILPDLVGWWALANHEDAAFFTETPMIPHPRAHRRGFVLSPLREVAPDWVHPVLNQSVSDLFLQIDSEGGLVDVLEISAGF